MTTTFSKALLVIVVLFLAHCKNPATNNTAVSAESVKITENQNAPAEGFDDEGSHPMAILLADQMMNAMGGRARWDSSNVFHWNFLGKRTLLWDKRKSRVRIEIPSENKVVALDMNTGEGKAWEDGEEIQDSKKLREMFAQAQKIWINDSYWLFMPFKLKDTGVTLSYLREEESLKGEPCHVLRLTFEDVGVTPQNAYEVWVSTESRLMKQWAYFKNADDKEPRFVLPWDDYQEYNGLLLAGNRGERDITEIKVMDTVPGGAFENAEPLRL